MTLFILFCSQQYPIVCVYHIFLTRSSVSGRLGCCHVLAIVQSAAMNTGVCVSFLVRGSSGCMPGSGTARSCGLPCCCVWHADVVVSGLDMCASGFSNPKFRPHPQLCFGFTLGEVDVSEVDLISVSKWPKRFFHWPHVAN